MSRATASPAARPEVLRVANCSGFYGDRFAAAREMVEGGPIDVLTGDYLAELTMSILWKARQKDPGAGYAATFIRQMEQVLGTCLERGIKIVANAGGLNPAGLAAKLRELATRLGLEARIAHIEGDDVLARIPALEASGVSFAHLDRGVPLGASGVKPVTANAYLGAWGIVEALRAGADVVVCPRVTDASLVVGPAAWRFEWARDDWDRLAAAVVAGHIIECGAQTTGGNYSFFAEVPGLEHPGFPLVEISRDGSFVVTKHPGTGGLVSVGTVTAQLLYEIGSPRYLNPDATARFDSIRLEQQGQDRVRASDIRGEPPPATAKVCINYLGGYRNSVTFVLTGLDIDAKAELAASTLLRAVGGREQFAEVAIDLVRHDRPDPGTNEEASALLRITVKDRDPRRVGRAFSNAAVEMALASYPGLHLTAPPGGESEYSVYWPALMPADAIEEVVVLPDGERVPVRPRVAGAKSGEGARLAAGSARDAGPADVAAVAPRGDAIVARRAGASGATRRVPLGTLVGARSGDKGGNANVGVWARSDATYAWLEQYLTIDRFKRLIGEASGLEVERFVLPNLRALNFVVVGLLGEGVASSTRFDPQAKSLGEYLRAKLVDAPEELLGS